MKTDKEIYSIFSINSAFLFELIKKKEETRYLFQSVEIKEFSRIMDGLFIPEDSKKIHYVLEVQNQNNKRDDVYHRIIMEMAILGYRNPGKIYHGILIFTDESLDPKTEPWHGFLQLKDPSLTVYYLDSLLEELEKSHPNHPLVAVFKPLVEKNEESLEKNARTYYNQIQNSEVEKPVRSQLLEVFLQFMMSRFKKDHIKEVFKMLQILTPLEETQSYKDIFAEGETKGRTETVKNMLQVGFKWDMIQKCTGINEKKFKQLSAKLSLSSYSSKID